MVQPDDLLTVVQSVELHWWAAHRGATTATERGRVPLVVPLPAGIADRQPGPVVVHRVRARADEGWALRDETPDRPRLLLDRLDVRLVEDEGRVDVVASPPYASEPHRRGRRVLTLPPGELGRWVVNHRMTDVCGGAPWYEQWSVHVVRVPRAAVVPDLLLREPDRTRDERVALYGSGAVHAEARPAR